MKQENVRHYIYRQYISMLTFQKCNPCWPYWHKNLKQIWVNKGFHGADIIETQCSNFLFFSKIQILLFCWKGRMNGIFEGCIYTYVYILLYIYIVDIDEIFVTTQILSLLAAENGSLYKQVRIAPQSKSSLLDGLTTSKAHHNLEGPGEENLVFPVSQFRANRARSYRCGREWSPVGDLIHLTCTIKESWASDAVQRPSLKSLKFCRMMGSTAAMENQWRSGSGLRANWKSLKIFKNKTHNLHRC